MLIVSKRAVGGAGGAGGAGEGGGVSGTLFVLLLLMETCCAFKLSPNGISFGSLSWLIKSSALIFRIFEGKRARKVTKHTRQRLLELLHKSLRDMKLLFIFIRN